MKESLLTEAAIVKSTEWFLPKLDLAHLRRLTTSVGIVQHAKFATPDYKHGYCLDDNCRALMLCGMANRLAFGEYDKLIDTYLAFILYMQRKDGQFGNFLSFDHQFLDDNGTEDAFGRTIWSLGSSMKNDSRLHIRQIIKELVDRAFPHLEGLRSLRAIAYSLCGLVALAESGHYPKDLFPILRILGDKICTAYEHTAEANWKWFENILAYDNAIIPYSLFRVYNVLHYERYLAYAVDSAVFLDAVIFEGGEIPHVVGNEGWYPKGGDKAQFGQQAIEIPSLILMYQQLAKLVDSTFNRQSERSFLWFHGNNFLRAELFDPHTKGCRDGLDKAAVNQNQGAESCICYWQAYLYHFHQLD